MKPPVVPKLFTTSRGRVVCDSERCRQALAASHSDGAAEIADATAVTDDQASEWFVTIGSVICCAICGARHPSGAIGQRERPRAPKP